MRHQLEKYAGRDVELIYIDRKQQITRRIVGIRRIAGDIVKVFDYERKAPRLLRIENILALQLVMQRVV